MRIKKLISILLVLTMVFALVSCKKGEGESSEPEDNKGQVTESGNDDGDDQGEVSASNTVRVGLMTRMDAYPLFLMDLEGSDTDKGIELKLSYYDTGKEMVKDFEEGKLDLIFTDIITSYDICCNGNVSANIISTTPSDYRIVTAPGEKKITMAELAGYRLSSCEDNVDAYLVDYLLAQADMSKDDLLTVYNAVGYKADYSAALCNDTSAALLPEPWATALEHQEGIPLTSSMDLGLNITCITANYDFIKGDLFNSFVEAYNYACDRANEVTVVEVQEDFVTACSFPINVMNHMARPNFYGISLPEEEAIYDLSSWYKENVECGILPEYSELVYSTLGE